MKTFFSKYKHLTSLLAVVVLAIAATALGFPPAAAFVLVCLYQLSQLAMSKGYRRGRLCIAALTDEQVKEIEGATKAASKFISDNTELFKGLNDKEKGFEALRKLPGLLTDEQKRVDELQGDMKKLKKLLAKAQGSHTGVKWVDNVPFVTDECARSLASVLVIETAKLGENAMRQLNREQRSHEGLLQRAGEYLGIENLFSKNAEGQMVLQKAALDGTTTPLPTIYVPQIIELVFKYGQARQYCTVFPLGAGSVKLPRLQAGEDDFGYLGAGTAGMSQAIAEKRVSAELVTFTANKAGGLIRIPMELEEDTFIPLGQFLARYIGRQLAKLEDKTVFIGDGTATYANQTGIIKYCQTNAAYMLQLAAGKTAPSDMTLDDIRNLRSKVSAAVLGNMAANGQTAAAYYMHPTWEPWLRSLNKGQLIPIYTVENGVPKLDGWPVRWTGVLQAYGTAAAPSAQLAVFGDLSYWYLGERGSVRVEISREVFFASDELAMRALERIDVEVLAVDAIASAQTPAQ